MMSRVISHMEIQVHYYHKPVTNLVQVLGNI